MIKTSDLFTSIKTSQLWIRPVNEFDAAEVLTIMSNKDNLKYTSSKGAYSIEEALQIIENFNNSKTLRLFAISLDNDNVDVELNGNIADNPIVGLLSVHIIESGMSVSIGTIGDNEYKFKYDSEALAAVFDKLIQSEAIWRVEYACHIDDDLTIAALDENQSESLQLEGIMRSSFQFPMLSSVPQDCRIYAKVKN